MNRNNIFITPIVIIASFALLTACNLAPEYSVPESKIPDSYNIPDLKWNKVNPSDNVDRGEWWKVFQDNQLSILEEKLSKDNFNTVNALAQYNESLALVEQARAAFLPTISSNVTSIKQKNITTTNVGTTSNISSVRALTLNASWEPDLWGVVASNVDASIATAEAAQASLESVRLSAQASLAQYYFEFCTVNSDDIILRDIVNAYDKNLQYINSRYQSGVAGQADILQAEIQLQAAKVQQLSNEVNIDIYRHAIAVLVGEQPATFKLKACSYDSKPHNISIGLPSTLLERRPDIAQAERLVAMANAEIGVAKSAYFPSLSLSVAEILQGNGMKKLLSFPFSAWSLGTSITQSIFSGGAQIAATDAAEERYNANVASYRQTVLSAFQDVEDSIVTLQSLRDQEEVQNESTNNAKVALSLVENQFKAGTVDYASVLASKITFYTSLKNRSDLEGLRISSEIALIKSLGGDWAL